MVKEKRKVSQVDVKDQQMMIDLGLHPNYRVIYDFSKTSKEKADLAKLRRRMGKGFYNQKWAARNKPFIPVYGKLIIYVYGENTKSIQCGQADIPDILVRIRKDPSKKILKYQWNGRTYQPNEIPFWKPRVKGGTSISVRSYAV